MDAVLDDAALEDAVVASQDAALARLRAKDFGGTLLRFVDSTARAPGRAPRRTSPGISGRSSISSSGSRSCGSSGRRCFGRCRSDRGARDSALGARRHRRRAATACAEASGRTRQLDAALRAPDPGSRIPSPRAPADDHQPMGPGGAPRRCDRRQRAGRARHAARAAATSRTSSRSRSTTTCATTCGRSRIRRARRGDVTIFHFALPSPMTRGVRLAAGRPRAAVPQHHAGGVLRALRSAAVPARGARPAASCSRSSGRVDLALGDSEFNRQELEALGFAPTGVLPIAVDTGAHHRRAARGRRWRRSSATA